MHGPRPLVGIAVAILLLVSSAPHADEGMWTFDNPPRAHWKTAYGFEPTDDWLAHVRLASVRLNDGGSGAFVSPDGLLMTNQHVAGGQLQKVSSAARDLVKTGFYAATRDAEIPCPDLEVNVLISYEDVTRQVQDAARAPDAPGTGLERRRAAIAAIEKRSLDRTGLRSEVVTLYGGGEYWLYRFKKYTDIRIVFSPEEQIAFFGGDYDNFTYPRYDLDVAFFRVYENGAPVKTDHYFRWSAAGPAERELVLVPGNPGSTARLLTLSQVIFQRDHGNPLQMRAWTTRRDALARYAARGPEASRNAAGQRRSLENSMKRLIGQQNGLLHQGVIEKKEREERALRSAVAANPTLAEEVGGAWDEVAAAYSQYPPYAARLMFSTLGASRLGAIASTLVRYAVEMRKPSPQRDREFRDSQMESLRFQLLSSAPIDRDMEEAILAAWLAEARTVLGDADPFVRAALNGAEPEEMAKRAVGGSALVNAATRRELLDGGPDAIGRSQDPLLELARRIDPVVRELRAWQEAHLQSVDASAGDRLARARFAVYGRSTYPDATFSPRLAYGVALGYEHDTTLVPFKTTWYGLYERAESFGYRPPFDLPARYLARRERLRLATPLNFVYTADTIGGNSGSPVINRNAEIVGLHFDSNVQKLANRYAYVDDVQGSRAVAVHSAAIIESLGTLYDAQPLADEILGTHRSR